MTAALKITELEPLSKEALRLAPLPRQDGERIAGFEVGPDPDRRSKLLHRWQEEKESLRRRLQEAGIEPLAIVPAAHWDRLCKEAGLYRFRPNARGHVHFSDTFFQKEVSERAKSLEIRTGVRSLLVGLFAAGALLLLSGVSPESFMISLVCFVGVTSIANFVMLQKNKQHPLQQVLSELPDNPEKLKELLWPEKEEPFFGPWLPIVFPDPPQDVQTVLRKAAKADLPLTVEVAPEAFAFASDPKELISEALAKEIRRREEERRRRLASAYDPVITVRKGGAVAIIAQFGEFPLEKRVVEQVLATVPLPM